jgi:hypothetical protein
VAQKPPPAIDSPAMSGSRTAPRLRADLDAAVTEIAVSKSAVLEEMAVAPADTVESRRSAPTRVPARLPNAPRRFEVANFLLAVLVLIAAGGAAAVVYFALPYLT